MAVVPVAPAADGPQDGRVADVGGTVKEDHVDALVQGGRAGYTQLWRGIDNSHQDDDDAGGGVQVELGGVKVEAPGLEG